MRCQVEGAYSVQAHFECSAEFEDGWMLNQPRYRSDFLTKGLTVWFGLESRPKGVSKDWILKCLQGGPAHTLAACAVATLGCPPPALLENRNPWGVEPPPRKQSQGSSKIGS